MLNLYNFYTDYQSLPLFNDVGNKIYMLHRSNRYDWGTHISEKDLEPVIGTIKRDSTYAYEYAKNIIGGRWPDGENAIKTSSYYALKYAKFILKRDKSWTYKSGRWPEAEPYIMKDGYEAYEYASDILAMEPTWEYPKGRWPEAEPYIMQSSSGAHMYAAYILKRRWPEAEPYIEKDEYYWNKYKDKFGIE